MEDEYDYTGDEGGAVNTDMVDGGSGSSGGGVFSDLGNWVLNTGKSYASDRLHAGNTKAGHGGRGRREVVVQAPAQQTNYTPFIIGGVALLIGVGALFALRK